VCVCVRARARECKRVEGERYTETWTNDEVKKEGRLKEKETRTTSYNI